MSDPQTIDALVEFGKMAGFVLTGSTVLWTGFVGGMTATMNVFERKYLRDQLMPLYADGALAAKPTIFNVYRLASPVNNETSH